MKVPLLDVNAQNAPLREEFLQTLGRLLEHNQFILGPEVETFERQLADTLHVKHVIGLSSGTDALLIALMALGIGSGDEVVTTPFSFYATAGCIVRLGAKPVLADIERDTFNLDPAAAQAACSAKTKAIIPVHLYGRPATATKSSVPVIEDAAQSIGAAPLAGLAGCLSFFPSKNLGALGDAGALYTDDDKFADKIQLLRVHGGRPKYYHHVVGGNFRIDALQAAFLSVKLKQLPRWTAMRRANAERYRALFKATSGIPTELVLPQDHPGHIYNQFVIRAPRRDSLREYLNAAGIGNEIYYPVPFHLQPCFSDLGYKKGAFPETEKACAEVLALPIYSELSAEQQSYVVEKIAAFYRET